MLAQGYRSKEITRQSGIDIKRETGAKKRTPRQSKRNNFTPVIRDLVIKKDLTAARAPQEIRARWTLITL